MTSPDPYRSGPDFPAPNEASTWLDRLAAWWTVYGPVLRNLLAEWALGALLLALVGVWVLGAAACVVGYAHLISEIAQHVKSKP